MKVLTILNTAALTGTNFARRILVRAGTRFSCSFEWKNYREDKARYKHIQFKKMMSMNQTKNFMYIYNATWRSRFMKSLHLHCGLLQKDMMRERFGLCLKRVEIKISSCFWFFSCISENVFKNVLHGCGGPIECPWA